MVSNPDWDKGKIDDLVKQMQKEFTSIIEEGEKQMDHNAVFVEKLRNAAILNQKQHRAESRERARLYRHARYCCWALVGCVALVTLTWVVR